MVLLTCPACLEFSWDDEGNPCRYCDGDGVMSPAEFKAWRDEAIADGVATFTRGAAGAVAWAVRIDNEPGQPWRVRVRTIGALAKQPAGGALVASLEDAVEMVRGLFRVPAERRIAEAV